MCEPALGAPAGMEAHDFRAMGTDLRVLVPAGSRDAAAATLRLFEEWEDRLSRFRACSELSRLNAAAGATVEVGELLFEILGAALDAARATAGLFDPTLLPQLARLGYDCSFELVRDAGDSPAGRPQPGGAWRRVVLDPARRTVTLPPGCAVDLGGIAKGMAVDAALGHLATGGVGAALVSAGGDLGVIGSPPGGSAWPISVGGEVVALERGAIATSSSVRRRWRRGDETVHHLLDPRTGGPVRSAVHTVSVAAGSCRVAEVSAKTALLLGPTLGARFLERHGLSARFESATGAVATGRWPTPAPLAA